MTTSKRTMRLLRGAIAAGMAGLALSSVVLVTAAGASTPKLPNSGVETPSGGTVTETGSTLLYPLFNLWAGGFSDKFSNTTIQTAGTGSGTGISSAENGTIDIGASDAPISIVPFSASEMPVPDPVPAVWIVVFENLVLNPPAQRLKRG